MDSPGQKGGGGSVGGWVTLGVVVGDRVLSGGDCVLSGGGVGGVSPCLGPTVYNGSQHN